MERELAHGMIDSYIPSRITHQPCTPKPMNEDEPRVSEFIQKDTEQWDVPKLHSMFNKQDTATILTIPLSKGLPEDKLLASRFQYLLIG